MGLLLKQLDIHGFKSFATPTTFVFDRGITAIVGPNGSGKSNVAEALRWVLGEQGHANLRSRRTEDVIFAGSDKRAQQSLAEVTLTLDNSDGSLPLAFAEVTVTRRAFRTGENQYLINGGRVRLKDVQQLVAPLGQAYTIIGQGLVDAALSQRPEERRGLFEHAAGISGLRLRANDAERGLTETGANAQRLRDIVGELEPRVRSLERSARLAREYGAVRERLRAAQRLQYVHQWALLSERVTGAQDALKTAEADIEQQRQAHAAVTAHLSELRGAERQLATTIESNEALIRGLEQELVRARHQHELLDARERASLDRIADSETALRQFDRDRAETLASIAKHNIELRGLTEHVERLQQALAEREALAAQAVARRESTQSELRQHERLVVELTRRVAELEGQLSSLTDRRTQLQQEHEQLSTDSQRASLRQEELVALMSSRAAKVDAVAAEAEQLAADVAGMQAKIDEAQQAARELIATGETAERELTTLRARLEGLERTHMSGEGFYAGVRSVLRAVNRGELEMPGLVGVLAEAIEVPSELETAIEVALGGHLQDIVVRHWSDAQTAIAFLKRQGSGRATFQPLDTVRAHTGTRLTLRDAGLYGVAAELITSSDDVRVVINQLLGRTLIVADMEAARQLVSQGGGWTIVTLSGEITRPAGSVTGGARTAEAGILARERKRRTLPATIAAADAKLGQLRDLSQRQATNLQQLRAEHQTMSTRLIETQRLLTIARADADQAQREHSTHLAVAEANLRRITDIASRIEVAASAESTARQELHTATTARDSHVALADELRVALQALTVDADASVAALRAELAGANERTKATQSVTAQLRQRAGQLAESIETRRAEIERLTVAASEIAAERESVRHATAERQATLATQQAALPPLRERRATLAAAIAAGEQELDQSIAGLRDGERERDRAALNVARAQDERVFLVERIRNDLDIADPNELGQHTPEGLEVPDEQEIARLRERLRRMAVVGTDVVEQYEAEAERLDFLTRQLQDVDDATAGLRAVLDELNAQMTTRFSATFRNVAVAFEETFTRLFGGGSARLVFSEEDGGTHGIDIVAQPPGKRLQNLNALSGGERALTAVALLIAIQRVNPSPFCLLDEVDAALDESNVLRFRDEIQELARSTQFVLITHNRGTIEGADTLYGVTMGDDGISRVLSLRLDDAIAAVDTLDAVEVS